MHGQKGWERGLQKKVEIKIVYNPIQSEFSRETEPAGCVEMCKLRDWLKEVAHEIVEVGRPDIQKLNSFFPGKPLLFSSLILSTGWMQLTHISEGKCP